MSETPDGIVTLASDRSKQSLREHEAILRSFFDSAGVMRGIVEVVDGRIIHVSCNQAAADMFGVDRDSIAGKSAREAGATEAVERTWTALYEDSRRTGMPVSTEYARRDAQGRERWLLVTASYLGRGDLGSPRFAYTIVDLTERKHAEEALREREAHYRTLSETMLQGVVYQDAEGKILSMNPAAERILGKTQAEYLGNTSVGVERDSIREDGSPFPGVAHPSMVALATGHDVRAVRMGVYNPRQQQYRWIEINAVPLFRAGETKAYQVYTIFEDITERKLAEEMLHKHRQWLEVTLESIGDAVLATDAEGGIVFINPVAAVLTGWTEGEALGRQSRDVLRTINAQTREAGEDMVARVLRDGTVVAMANHTVLVSRDGREVPIEDSAAPIRSRAGSVLGVVLVFHDVTEKRRAQRELENVLNSISDGLLVLDRNWRYTYFSEHGARMLGMRREDLIGGCVWDLFPHAKGTDFYEGYHRAVETGQPLTIVEYYPEPLNKWLECRCYPSEAGLSVYFQDITERKLAEDAVREREILIRTLSDNLPEGAIYRYRRDADGQPHVDFISAGIERLTGVPAADFMADAAEVERNIVPEDRACLNAAIELSMERLTRFEVEVRHVNRQTGDIRWSLMRSSPTRNPDGSTTWDGVELDITQRRLAQEALRASEAKLAERTAQLEQSTAELEARNREVERVNRMKSEFLARSSHELRTPLNAIVGYSDLLSEQSSGPLPPPYPRFVSNIQEGARHLLDMVNDLLDLSRIEAGRIELNLESFDVSVALDEVLSVITPLSAIKSVLLDNRVVRDTVVVADRVRFKQILYNLMSNAVKFTPEEGRIWVETASDGELFTISVGDTGIGIAADEQDAIFEEFHQVASARKHSGSGAGLGLAITRKLARLHGGDVQVESRVDEGSRFVVTLPAAAESIRGSKNGVYA